MDKVPLCRGGLLALLEYAKLVAYARRGQASHLDAYVELVGRGRRREVSTACLYHHADHLAFLDVERVTFNQITVYRGIKIGIIGDVVDVAIDIVVHPACVNGRKDAKHAARCGLGSAHVVPSRE